MTRSLLFLLLLPPFFSGPGDGEKKGRQGNVFYAAGQYEQAAAAYREGLAGDAAALPQALRYGLQHNLGAALHRAGDFDAADKAFAAALAAAASDADVARAAYNAGNNAFNRQDLEGALARYRDALLADPSNVDAKFNYEFVKRQLQQQQQQQNKQGQNDNQQQQQNQDQQQQDQQGDQQQDQQGEEQQDDQGQQQQQQDQEGEEEQQQQQQQRPTPDPSQMSQEQAELILQALQNEEEKLLRQVQQPKTQPRRVEKDW